MNTMGTRATGLALSGLILSAGLLHAQRGNPEVQFEGRTVDQMIGAYMKEHDVPGMALAIVQAPYVTRVVGYGVADPKTGRLVGSRTLFQLGVMQEAWTAVAVMQLTEAGKVRLEEPIGTYLKDLPETWKGIAVRDVVRNASGIPDFTRVAFPKSKGTAWQAVADKPLLFEPGTNIERSATNHLLLQQLIESVSRVSYEDFVQKGQIEKLGLRETHFAGSFPEAEQAGHKAFLTTARLINPIEAASGTAGKDASADSVSRLLHPLYASALDVSVWDIGLAGSILIQSPELRKILYTSMALKVGKKVPTSGVWKFPGRPGLMLVEGSGAGFSSLLSRYTAPEDLLCVTLLANRDGLDLTELARRIAAAFDPRLAQTE
jgi:D-alanyl-D-alanine carboxypeptidase